MRASEIYELKHEDITRREMTSRLTAATDGLKVIHDALLNNDDTISTIVLCNALEPFLKELYVLKNSFAGGLKKEAGEVS